MRRHAAGNAAQCSLHMAWPVQAFTLRSMYGHAAHLLSADTMVWIRRTLSELPELELW